jgi:hypothetical protein
MEAQILAALDASILEFHGDPRRVYRELSVSLHDAARP